LTLILLPLAELNARLFPVPTAQLCARSLQPLKIAFGEGKKKLLSLGMHQDTQSKAKLLCVSVLEVKRL
jgi:hypothetical protein